MVDIGDVSYLFGAFYGILVSQKVSPGLISYPVVNDTLTKRVSRTIIAICLVAPWIVLLYLVRKHSKNAGPYELLLFQGMIPSLGISVSLFLFADILSNKLGMMPR